MVLAIFSRKRYKSIIKNINDENIHELRKKIKILMIDDKQFGTVEVLNNRGYNVFYKNDITYIEEAEPFDFIIADIQGVAMKFGTHGGFSYAREIKKVYPHKMVLCYSGTTTDLEINQRMKEIDGFIKKDVDVDEWVDKLDHKIKDYSDVNYHWNITREQLKAKNVSLEDLNKIEKLYIESFEYGKIDNLRSNLMGKLNDTNLVLSIITSIMQISKIFV